MGWRFYNATRGLFTSLDPIPGGNDTPYTYPGDPINMLDLDGRLSLGRAAKFAGWAAFGACVVFSAGACAVAGAVALGMSVAHNYSTYRAGKISGRGFARRTAVDFGLMAIPGGRSLRLVGRHFKPGQRVSRGFIGTARAIRAGARHSRHFRHVSRHAGGRSSRAGVRHSYSEFRGNWAVRPWRSASRVGYGAGASYIGNRWG